MRMPASLYRFPRTGTVAARASSSATSSALSGTVVAAAFSATRPLGAAARERALAERAAQGRLRGALARLVGARTEERAWRIGADGEEAVAAQLAKLGPEWRVLHAVRVGQRGSDIDHVAIGPAGVFTVNAKHHPNASVWVGGDTFMVNGRRLPYVRNSRHEARRAGRRLTAQVGFPVTATGVIAVMGATRASRSSSNPRTVPSSWCSADASANTF
ncbi:nuclease-related domain-containing protein [Georgenia sp. H159]|uniref:nuclease-related domain-containing protein n=1 Tax=Georgenia sp. H159 TaxID=3076115 RepID=UPI002D7788EC|nr:nuclease-related domain-containing protein [Georgenia sp. H159]